MTNDQYVAAEADLLSRLQSMREAQRGIRAVSTKRGEDFDSDDVCSLDDVYDTAISSEFQAAKNEWVAYCSVCKKKRHCPNKFRNEGLITVGDIQLGVVEERGADIQATSPFKQCNLADFIDSKGYFDLVKFVGFNEKSFPYIYKLVCCLAALRTNEVGCERFFSLAGYVSNPRRTRLHGHHYESIAMLKRNMNQVYIDEDWVVKEYQTKEKTKDWDETDRKNDEYVAALEDELFAADAGDDAPDDVPEEDDVQVVEAAAAMPVIVDLSDTDSDSD